VHQQHIRDALRQPGLKERRFFGPVLDAFARALPRTFSAVSAARGTVVQLIVTGEAGGNWFVVKDDEGWTLWRDVATEPDATTTIDQETAWRLFTKGINREEASRRAVIQGDHALGTRVLDTVAIMA
jgi:hypothetical protein